MRAVCGLNFELNVECYGREFAHEMAAVLEKKLHRAREVTKAEVDARTMPGKLRDATARLFSPVFMKTFDSDGRVSRAPTLQNS